MIQQAIGLGVAAGLLVGVLSGCAQTAHVGEHFSLSGTPEGIRAFSDYQVGQMKTAKESADQDSEYFKHRNEYERLETVRRVGAPQGFVQKLFQGSAAEQGGK